MELIINQILLKKLPQYKAGKEEWQKRFSGYYRWKSDEEFFAVDIEIFEPAELDVLFAEASKSPDTKHRNIVNKIGLFRNVAKDPSGLVIKRLDQFEQAARSVIRKLPNKWLFVEDDGLALPYYVSAIAYVPYNARARTAAHVSISLAYAISGKVSNRSIAVYMDDFKGKVTFVEILKNKGFFPETEKLVSLYLSGVEWYKAIHTKTGMQFLAKGKANIIADGWSRGTVSMERDGYSTKVVMDDMIDTDEDNEDADDDEIEAVSTAYWTGKKRGPDDDDVEDADEAEVIVPPLHPFVKVFDLSKHRYVQIHVSFLEEYKYDSSIQAKLVLPKHKKDLVDILVQGTAGLMEDIIKGKTGGIIVLATGVPGTGKTLTAEVYAETVKKPLYIVQCSQLGTDEEELEKHLTKVLARASRWGAILLIDEADVYVHERGSDITQNAIVGVFLRVLEYYRGILFLTSNRATIIDDAIISRVTAHIRYDVPNAEESVQIWTVLSDQFKMKLVDDIGEYHAAFPKISGRSIKNLLKLSKLLSDRNKKPVTVELVKYASQFLDGMEATPE